LLRFTQDRLLIPSVARARAAIDTRILAATSRTAPPGKAGAGGLRADLAARLGAEPIRIPPLRERMEDLGALISFILTAPSTVRSARLSGAVHARMAGECSRAGRR